MRKLDQKGFSTVAILLIILVVAAVVFVGLKVMDKSDAPKDSQATSESKTASDVSAAPAITKTSDLTKADMTLDQTDPSSSSDLSDLNTQLDSF